MRRPLGFILSTDPDAAQVAILAGNGTIPAGEDARYAAIAAGNAAGIAAAAAARPILPGVSNQTLLFAGLGTLALLVVAKGRR